MFKNEMLLIAITVCLTTTMIFADDHTDRSASYASVFIKKYDVNDDGKLNADEYPSHYRKYFGRSDSNSDGYVDASEVATQFQNTGSQWREQMKKKAEEFRVAKLQKLVDRAFAGDVNDDGRLNADEASAVIDRSFGEVDVDDDGYLARAEVEKAFGLAPKAGVAAKNIVATAIDAGSFSTLVKAIQVAGLTDALSGDDELTVFAPTDEAFSRVPADVLEGLLSDKKKLQAVLTYHVLPDKILADDIVGLKSAKSLQGQSVNIRVDGRGVKIDGANVLKTDILCSNGVIHVIDSVILPELSADEPSPPNEDASNKKVSLLPIGSGEIKKQWVTVNDGVMGGVSEGNVRWTDDKTMEFYGDLSLRNNGGFASVRSMPQALSLEPGDTLVVRIRGDGREYYLNLYEPSYRMAFSFRAPVKTKKDEWIEVRVPLSDFYATSFGRRVSNAKLNPAKVNSVGFILSDKKAGPFSMEVDSIRIEKPTE